MYTHDLLLDDEHKLVRATVRGSVPKAEGRALVARARIEAAKRAYGILWDLREAKLQVQLADFFFLPRELEVLQKPPTRRVKVALLASAEDSAQYRFYENVAHNLGLTVKVFLEEEQAVAWLAA